MKLPDGSTDTVTARYLAGCDGPSSATRHALDLGFGGGTDPRVFYVADVEMDYEAAAGTVHATFLEDTFVVMFPLPEARRWRSY